MPADQCNLGKGLLFVDLDGALLPSRLQYEAFWASLASRGQADKAVTSRSWIKRLPFDAAVIRFVRRWQDDGGKTVLVSRAMVQTAELIADDLGIFDATVSPETTDGGAIRAEIGDAKRVVYLTGTRPGEALIRMANERVGTESVVSGVTGRRVLQAHSYLRAMRPQQWVKNLLVFMPLVLAHDVSTETLARAALVFSALCLVASGVYVLNDLLDLGTDRAHPRKRNRPIASGAIPLERATAMAPLLLIAGLCLATPLGATVLAVLGLYVVVTSAYSLSLKHRFLADILILAGLYTLRVIAGGVATGVHISGWLLAFSGAFFLSLAAVKRQAELVGAAPTGGPAGSGHAYTRDKLPLVEGIAVGAACASVVILFFYFESGNVRANYDPPQAVLLLCLIIAFWLAHIIRASHLGKIEDDPVRYALDDPVSWLSIALIVAMLVWSWPS